MQRKLPSKKTGHNGNLPLGQNFSVPSVQTSSASMKRKMFVTKKKKKLAPRCSVTGFIVMIYNFDVAPDCNVNRPIKFVISNAKARLRLRHSKFLAT